MLISLSMDYHGDTVLDIDRAFMKSKRTVKYSRVKGIFQSQIDWIHDYMKYNFLSTEMCVKDYDISISDILIHLDDEHIPVEWMCESVKDETLTSQLLPDVVQEAIFEDWYDYIIDCIMYDFAFYQVKFKELHLFRELQKWQENFDWENFYRTFRWNDIRIAPPEYCPDRP